MAVAVAACAAGGVGAQEPVAPEPVSVSGEWMMTVEHPAGAFEWVLSLEQRGATLDGYVESQGRTFPVEGRVDGAEVTLTIELPAHAEPFEFTATVEGAALVGEVAMGETVAWRAERLDEGPRSAPRAGPG